MPEKADVIIVGGGIVGLATAYSLLCLKPSLRLVLLEKELRLAQHQTGHNSGVIHSGLYYKPGSQKAVNCRKGYDALLAFCRKEGIPHDICGKIVVATNECELPGLDTLYQRGLSNGLSGIRILSTEEIHDYEPHCYGQRGLYVPETGIVDYSCVAEKYAEKIMEAGGRIILGECVADIKTRGGYVEAVGSSSTWSGRAAVVCAGLYSDKLARKTWPDLSYRILPFRGEYYKFKTSAPQLVNKLIYPVPDPAFPFLGVHFTRMIDGFVECGPNAVFAFGREAYNKIDFSFSDTCESLLWAGFRGIAKKHWQAGFGEYWRSFSKKAFVRALQKLVPEIQEEHLEPAAAGIRAQACDRQGNLIDDFDIRYNGNIIHVCNAPSPAATASLAIGDTIACRTLMLFL